MGWISEVPIALGWSWGKRVGSQIDQSLRQLNKRNSSDAFGTAQGPWRWAGAR